MNEPPSPAPRARVTHPAHERELVAALDALRSLGSMRTTEPDHGRTSDSPPSMPSSVVSERCVR